MPEKKYIRGNTEITETKCRRCGLQIVKNNPLQIVYYCSECHADRKKPRFRFIKE